MLLDVTLTAHLLMLDTFSDPRKIRWGILSTARIGRNAVIPAIKASRNGEVIAVASRDPAKARAFAVDLNIPRTFDSYEALIADPEIDAIYNPLPNDGHAPWTIKALEAGKHVLVEKPFALTVVDAKSMIAAAQHADRQVAEAFMYRFHPQHDPVHTLIRQGKLGKPSIIRAAFTYSLTSENNVRLKPELGGGGLWDVGCYCVNSARWLAGEEPDWVSGSATIGSVSQVDESFVGLLHFPSGLLAHFECGMRGYSQNEYAITGSTGRAYVQNAYRPDEQPGRIAYAHDGQNEIIEVPPINQYTLMVEDFADAIIDQRPPRFTSADALQNTRVLVALLESAQSGQPTRLTD